MMVVALAGSNGVIALAVIVFGSCGTAVCDEMIVMVV